MIVAAQDTALHTIVNMTPFIPEISGIRVHLIGSRVTNGQHPRRE